MRNKLNTEDNDTQYMHKSSRLVICHIEAGWLLGLGIFPGQLRPNILIKQYVRKKMELTVETHNTLESA